MYYDLKPRPLKEKEYVNEIIEHIKALEKNNWKASPIFGLSSSKKNDTRSLANITDLSVAINNLFSRDNVIKTIDIFAHSSQAFFQHIRPKLRGTERIRILIRNPQSQYLNSFIEHMKNKEAIESERGQINNAILSWSEAIRIGKVQEGLINLYDFEPSFYVCILNGRFALFGLFNPTQLEWGYCVKDSSLIDCSNEAGEAFIANLSAWFESILNEKSERYVIDQ